MPVHDLRFRVRHLIGQLATAAVLCVVRVQAQAVAAAPASAPVPSASADSAQRFYFEYRRALTTAKTLADLQPWMTRAGYADATKIPPAQRTAVFRALRGMNVTIQQVVVVDRVAIRDTVVLRLRGLDRRDGEAMSGGALVIREGGLWKLRREDWRPYGK